MQPVKLHLCEVVVSGDLSRLKFCSVSHVRKKGRVIFLEKSLGPHRLCRFRV